MEYNFLDIDQKIKISKICLGTMTWGYQNTEAEAHQQIDYALTQGINFIDTAEVYAVPPSADTYGKTETYIGSWFSKNPHKRKDIILASKMVGIGMNYIRGGAGLNPHDVASAIDASLKRLQTDYIDLYQLHWPQRKVNYFGQYNYNPSAYSKQNTLQETNQIKALLEALAIEIAKGKIRHIGVSNETPWGIVQYLNHATQNPLLPRIQTIQNPYSLVSRLFDVNLSEVCMKEQVGLLAYSPLAGGLLSGKYRNNQKPSGARFSTWGFTRMDRYKNAFVLDACEQYALLAEKSNLSPSQLALAFVNQRPFLTANIIGATSMTQLKENIDAINIKLNADILSQIEKIFDIYRNPAS